MPRGEPPSPWRHAGHIVLSCVAATLIVAVSLRYRHAIRRHLSKQHNQRLLGILLILLVVVLWTASSIVVQLVFETEHFRKPFFLTYFSSSLLVVYLLFYPRRVRGLVAALRMRFSNGHHPVSVRYGYDILTAGKTDSAESAFATATEASSLTSGGGRGISRNPLDELGIAIRLECIFFLYQLLFNVGLELSSVSTVTIISASSGLWTLGFSALRLRERVGPVKLLSTILTFVGVLTVVLSSTDRRRELRDAASAHGQLTTGEVATLFSALLYGAYAAQLKHEVPSEEVIPMPYLFGLFGLLVAILFAPGVVILHVLRVERFAPPTGETLLALALNGLFGSVISNMLLARAMVLASPLVATVGLSLSIPLAIASDVWRGRGDFSGWNHVLGTLAVWTGFLGVSSAEAVEERCMRTVRGPRLAMQQETPIVVRVTPLRAVK